MLKIFTFILAILVILNIGYTIYKSYRLTSVYEAVTKLWITFIASFAVIAYLVCIFIALS
jgi:hypothetical protein